MAFGVAEIEEAEYEIEKILDALQADLQRPVQGIAVETVESWLEVARLPKFKTFVSLTLGGTKP